MVVIFINRLILKSYYTNKYWNKKITFNPITLENEIYPIWKWQAWRQFSINKTSTELQLNKEEIVLSNTGESKVEKNFVFIILYLYISKDTDNVKLERRLDEKKREENQYELKR